VSHAFPGVPGVDDRDEPGDGVPAASDGAWGLRAGSLAARRIDASGDLLLDLLQWPAMAVTIAAAWLVGSRSRGRRKWGFRCFLASNVLWVGWGWHDGAYALVALQVALAAMNVRGMLRNDPQAPPAPGD
jgi:hypothetical protein